VKEFTALIEQTGFTGFYFRVLRHGEVRAGDAFALERRLHPAVTVTHCNKVYYRRKQDAAAARELSECPELSGGWKDMFYARARALTAA